MNNPDLSQRIKELRTLSGFSQAELADNARLSLRTVQRIESGEVKPRGFTLQSLARALNISADELTEWQQKSDKLFLIVLNLSALAFLFFPLLAVFVPLILWALKRNEGKAFNEVGRAVLNFQITWVILFVVGYTSIISGITQQLGGDMISQLIIFAAVLYLFNILSIIINVIRVQYNKPVKYFIPLRFLR